MPTESLECSSMSRALTVTLMLGVIAVLLVACKAPKAPAVTDAGLDAPNVPQSDAAIDGAIADSPTVLHECDLTPATSYAFTNIYVGQLATAWFVVPHGDNVFVLATITGAEFSVQTEPQAQFSRVKVIFKPTAPGTAQATLTVSNLASPPVMIPISADVAAVPDGLVAGAPAVHGGPFVGGVVELANRSSSKAIELDSETITSPDAPPALLVDTTQCPDTLLPGDSCLVRVSAREFTPAGCHHYTVHLHSSANTVDIDIDGRATTSIVASSDGGSISSSPGGLYCSNLSCSAQFADGPVVLTALSSSFEGWDAASHGSGLCGPGKTCILPVAEMFNVGARFAASGAPAISLSSSGSAAGGILFLDDAAPMLCDDACTYAPQGPVRLVAAGTSAFLGWSGACSGTLPQCYLDTVSANATAIATFAKDDREVATVTPPQGSIFGGAQRVAMLPGGDLVTATADTLARVTPGGAVAWRRTTRTRDLVATSTGDIYMLDELATTPMLFKLDGNGTTVWSRALIHRNAATDCNAQRSLAVDANGDVAIVAFQRLWIVSGLDGSDLFTDSVPGCRGVAADLMGTVVVAVSQGTAGAIRRYANHVRVLPDWIGPFSNALMDLVFDPSGSLVISANGDSGSSLTRISPSGLQVFSIARGSSTAYTVVAAASNGAIVTVDNDSGLRLQAYDPSGTLTWTLAKPQFVSQATMLQLVPAHVATDANGRVAITGVQRSAQFVRPWAEIFQLP